MMKKNFIFSVLLLTSTIIPSCTTAGYSGYADKNVYIEQPYVAEPSFYYPYPRVNTRVKPKQKVVYVPTKEIVKEIVPDYRNEQYLLNELEATRQASAQRLNAAKQAYQNRLNAQREEQQRRMMDFERQRQDLLAKQQESARQANIYRQQQIAADRALAEKLQQEELEKARRMQQRQMQQNRISAEQRQNQECARAREALSANSPMSPAEQQHAADCALTHELKTGHVEKPKIEAIEDQVHEEQVIE